MAEKSNSSVYIGNLDERVGERVLYDILIQAGRVVDLHIPRDKETDKAKGYAFAEYESEEVAEYAVKLFTGVVTLYRRTLKFGMSGQDKSSASLSLATPPTVGSFKQRSHQAPYNDALLYSQPSRTLSSCRDSDRKINPEVPSDISVHQPSGYRSFHDSTDYNYSRRMFGSVLDSVSRSSSGRYEMRDSMNHNRYY